MRGLLLVTIGLLVASAGGCVIGASRRGDPPGEGGSSATGGAGGGGGEGGVGGETVPWTSGDASLVPVWHREMVCAGSSVAIRVHPLGIDGDQVVVGGHFNGSCAPFEGEPTPSDGPDPWLAAIALEDGATRWATHVVAPGTQRIQSLAVAGGLALAGDFDAPFALGGASLNPLPTSDVPPSSLFLGALDETGQASWAHAHDVNGLFAGVRVARAPNGDVVMVGDAHSPVDFGGGSLDADLFNSFVVRFAADGSHVHSGLIEPLGFDVEEVDDVVVDSLGRSWLAGRFVQQIDLGGGTLTASEEASYLAVLDDTGSFLHGLVVHAVGCRLDLRPLGEGALVAAVCSGALDFGAGPKGSEAVGGHVLRLAGDGALLWHDYLGESIGELHVDGDPSGGVVVAGTFADELLLGDERFASAGRKDAFLAELSASGEILAAQRFGGEYDDVIEDVRHLGEGRYLLGGAGLQEAESAAFDVYE
ncbi:MAG: hypothetical protein KC731_13500, partial [Myxococcales bacterium]|nr:hypothetical protein [Myxococcales bacterium]